MLIESIESIHQSDNRVVYVTAVIEDAVIKYDQTFSEPAEYDSALCEASFELCEDEYLPDNDNELIEFLEELDLDWIPVSNEGWYT